MTPPMKFTQDEYDLIHDLARSIRDLLNKIEEVRLWDSVRDVGEWVKSKREQEATDAKEKHDDTKLIKNAVILGVITMVFNAVSGLITLAVTALAVFLGWDKITASIVAIVSVLRHFPPLVYLIH